ncbi:uncharacterized protein LODBEIA_P42580 [Lodderomyces beijingensis]|uniref:CID domain-containing protein n=1 Tax=Lodderomyces beijingensis TaxID=1775926 RepID=A0ABP0ZPG2_9ASCO
MTDVLTEYKNKLSELSFNSQPIITELTQKAKQHPELADQIMDLVSERIYHTVPEQKLYALYVLDDICKVIGNPYNILIGDEIYSIFVHVFQMNNDTIRDKMVRLFNTWKVSTLRNTDILTFPKEQLSKIEQFLKKAEYPRPVVTSPRQRTPVAMAAGVLPPRPGVSLQQSLINDIDHLIPIFEAQLRGNNNRDAKVHDRFKALNKLKTLLSSKEMKPVELEAIKTHIVNIQAQTVTPATTPIPPPHPQPSPAAIVNPAMGLFQDLILSGLVKKEQEPIPGSKPVYTLMFPEEKYSRDQGMMDLDTLEDILLQSSSIPRSEYDKLKFVELMNVMKKTADGDLQHYINSNKPSSSLTDLLYDAKPSKCSICGKRFATDAEGTTGKRLHLDWHFRMNKKSSVKGGNIQSRNWYLDDVDWVQFDENTTVLQRTDQKENSFLADEGAGGGGDGVGAGAGAGAAGNGTGGQASYVVVPSNDTNMNNRCLICREQVRAKYNDEIGEWVWNDCMRQSGEKNSRRIVHVSCYNDRKRAADTDLNPFNIKREKI